jgi:competence protein ComEA
MQVLMMVGPRTRVLALWLVCTLNFTLASTSFDTARSQARAPASASAPAPAPPRPDAGAPGLVRVNTATLAELDALPGIGPAKAAAIIAERARRPFRRLRDLLRVPGIGRAMLARLAPLLVFE